VNLTAAINKKKTWLRLAGFLIGVVVLVWLAVEENNETGVLLISGLICTWGGVWLLYKTETVGRHMIFRYILVGGGAGLLLAPLAILLMAIKTSIHGHGSPDFTVDQMQNILVRIPYFGLGGVLLGTGVGLLRFVQEKGSQEE
jgi:hypothetical protein